MFDDNDPMTLASLSDALSNSFLTSSNIAIASMFGFCHMLEMSRHSHTKIIGKWVDEVSEVV